MPLAAVVPAACRSGKLVGGHDRTAVGIGTGGDKRRQLAIAAGTGDEQIIVIEAGDIDRDVVGKRDGERVWRRRWRGKRRTDESPGRWRCLIDLNGERTGRG